MVLRPYIPLQMNLTGPQRIPQNRNSCKKFYGHVIIHTFCLFTGEVTWQSPSNFKYFFVSVIYNLSQFWCQFCSCLLLFHLIPLHCILEICFLFHHTWMLHATPKCRFKFIALLAFWLQLCKSYISLIVTYRCERWGTLSFWKLQEEGNDKNLWWQCMHMLGCDSHFPCPHATVWWEI